jgi:hypothetical protein
MEGCGERRIILQVLVVVEGKAKEEGVWEVAVYFRGGGEVEGKEMEEGKGRRERVRRN